MYTTDKKRLSDPYMSYNFSVEIEGLIVGGFSEVSGLGSSIELETYTEGGLNTYTHQFPTRTTYPNLVLARGMMEVDTLWQWYRNASAGVIELKNVTLTLLNAKGEKQRSWYFKRAFPVKWQGPEFNATNDQVAIERIELVHQGVYEGKG